MGTWKLYVEDYGKIEKAEIECAPLTLIVGNNNCGKSYLMSLMWGLNNYGAAKLFRRDSVSICEEEIQLHNWLREKMEQTMNTGFDESGVVEILDTCESLINYYLRNNKEKLLAWIFNSEKVTIGKIEIRLNPGEIGKKRVRFAKKSENDIFMRVMGIDGKMSAGFGVDVERTNDSIDSIDFLLKGLLSGLLDIPYHVRGVQTDIYLPAARTGFMLAKDVVNTVGRNRAFNVEDEDTIVSPFTRPINQFLDVINGMPVESGVEERYAKIAELIEKHMVTGNIEISESPNREIMYMLQGDTKTEMPLRTVSAVVTELSPLILILKHLSRITSLYYEEPEMCLHPQLQHQMGRIMARMVNSGVQIIATTHSDILVQSINNKIALQYHPQKDSICRELEYDEADLLKKDMVKVYQFREEQGKTCLEEIDCGPNGFAVPTFNNALDDIMAEAYRVQGSEDE